MWGSTERNLSALALVAGIALIVAGLVVGFSDPNGSGLVGFGVIALIYSGLNYEGYRVEQKRKHEYELWIARREGFQEGHRKRESGE